MQLHLLLSTILLGCCTSFLFGIFLVLSKPYHGSLSMDLTDGVQKFHTAPTPRIGGIAIYVGLFITCFSLEPNLRIFVTEMLLAGLPAFIFGLAEDLTKRISVSQRLLATMASAFLAWWLTGYSISRIDIPMADALLKYTTISLIFTCIAVAGVANAVNIIDGFNGLASGMTTFAFLGFAWIAHQVGDHEVIAVSVIFAACTFGFFVVNWPLGKLFLGDGGSYLLGFALAWIAVLLVERNPSVSAFAMLLICIHPITEVLFSVYRRWRKKLHPGHPDRLHFHSLVKQRYVRRWFSTKSNLARNSATGLLMALATLITSATASVTYDKPNASIIACIVFLVTYVFLYNRMVSYRWLPRFANSTYLGKLMLSTRRRAYVFTPRPFLYFLVLCVDLCVCIISVSIAYYLRFGELAQVSGLPPSVWIVSALLAVVIFYLLDLNKASAYSSNINAIARALLLYGFLYASLFTAFGVDGVPRSIGLIQPIVFFVFVVTSRVLLDFWFQGENKKSRSPKVVVSKRSLIYGAGSAGRQLAIMMSAKHEENLIGYLDDDDRLHGHALNGLPIFSPGDLPSLVVHRNISDVLLAIPSATRERRNAILALITPLRLAVRSVLPLTQSSTGKARVSDLQELDVDDLLGRDAVKHNALLLNRNTHNKAVLVTGAGGSIGSELCRQILQAQPKQLLLVEMSEFALYQIHQELQALVAELALDSREMAPGKGGLADAMDGSGQKPWVEIVPLLASVCDEVRMQEIMDTWRPHTVYHAAAYKHVPLVEHNPAEGVHNNVWGTRICAEAAVRNGVRNFVLISTDKAVRPTNIMGATKRLAEMVLQALAELNPAVTAQGGPAPTSRTCFSMVRFGNVLGSSGSVVPLFREQIKDGGPITLTHADITRFFMTIPEAAQLVIQAGAMGTGGDVFVLDMGQPVRIVDLARRMVELSGLTVRDDNNPEGDIEITITGLRPGEKLYEELLIGENPIPTQHPRIMKAQEPYLPWAQLQQSLGALHMAKGANDVALIRGLLQQLVAGYEPAGEVVDWVYLAQEREAVGGE